MDTRDQRLFLAVCSTRNFSRAAEDLHLSVSTVSRGVQRLEDEFGCRLFERDRRGLRPTAAGLTLRDHAQRALADWRALRRELAGDSDLAGEISLFCSVTASYSVLSPVLGRFRAAHPRVEIMLHTGDQADGIARVSAGRDDLAVTLRPPRLPRAVDFLPLARTSLRLCIPAADCAVRRALGAQAEPKGHCDWSAVPFIVPERGLTKRLIDRWFAAQGIRRPRIYAQVAGHEAIVAMVALGLGAGFAPELVIRSGGLADGVELLAPPEPPPELVIGLAARAGRRREAAVGALWDVAAGTYPGPI